MVSKQTQDEIKNMHDEKERLKSLLENKEMDGEVSQKVSELSIHQLRGLVVKISVELQEASNQIKTLKQELLLQQEYYEKAMLEDRTEQETKHNNEQNSQTAQYRLLTAIETKNKKIASLENTLKELNEEKESAAAEIANLKKELKLQEDHFAQQLKN